MRVTLLALGATTLRCTCVQCRSRRKCCGDRTAEAPAQLWDGELNSLGIEMRECFVGVGVLLLVLGGIDEAACLRDYCCGKA